MPISYYIATGLENVDEAKALHVLLQENGWVPTYDWTTHGSAPERVDEISQLELDGVVRADIVFVILPGGKGTHAELGAALAKSRLTELETCFSESHVVIFGDNPSVQFERVKGTCVFYWHPAVTRVDKTLMASFMDGLLNVAAPVEWLKLAAKDWR